MLDEYFQREDVLRFIKELKTSPKCLRKSAFAESKYGRLIQDELALYLFYDIIFKYKIIIDDPYLFPDFLAQVEKVFRKIDDYEDVQLGITKILVNMVGTILDVHDIQSFEGRKEIIQYFYQKYITDGYLVHGYSTTYEEFIKGRDFVPEKYPNHYSRILKIKHLLAKNKISLVYKNFQDNSISFTDDFVMGCHYSVSSPGYFYQLLVRSDKDRALYLKQDYRALISSLKRFMNNHSVNNATQRSVLKMIEEVWNFLYRVPRKVSLLFVKRDRIFPVTDKLNEYLESDKDLIEIIERILMPKNNAIDISETLRYGEYQLVTLDDFYQKEDVKAEEMAFVKQGFLWRFANSSGVASLLLIVGSLLITFGVILSIIMIFRGM